MKSMPNKWRKEMPLKNKEQRVAYIKEYNKKNKEKIAARQKEYREKNKEKLAAQNKEYREKNKEKIIAYKKKYIEKNKEKIIASKKKYIEKNKEKIAASRRKRAYGLLPEDYDDMLKKQNNKCKICLVDFNDEALTFTDGRCIASVDHCHTTNKVRGLLCSLCNRGLGHFKDNIKLLTQAINYLKENT